VAADDQSAKAHSYYAITIGQAAQVEGIDASIKASYEVKNHTLKAIALDPSDPTNYHIMGRWHHTLAGLSWAKRALASMIYSAPPEASFEESADFFRKAMALQPEAVRHYLWLARALMALGRSDEARQILEKGVTLPPRDAYERRELEEAKTELAGL